MAFFSSVTSLRGPLGTATPIFPIKVAKRDQTMGNRHPMWDILGRPRARRRPYRLRHDTDDWQ